MSFHCIPLSSSVTDTRLTVSSDDLTVQVIFFGSGEKTGEVSINLDATAPGPQLKAKL